MKLSHSFFVLFPFAATAAFSTSCVFDQGEGAGPASGGGVGVDGAATGGLVGTGGVETGDTSNMDGGGTANGGDTGGTNTGGNSSGGAGVGGSATGGGDGSGGSTGAASEGCGTSTEQARASWQSSNVTTESGDRPYDTWLPEAYDSEFAYPVILLLHGCTSGTNNVPMEGETGQDAILVRGTGSADNTCWDTSTDGPDMDFVDAMIADVQDRFCVNPDQLFAVGYSSGSWLASRLSCNRGDVFRGIASVTGGEPSGISDCSGQVGRMFIHDQEDNDNKIEWNTPSRDRMIETNNCSTTTMPVEPSPCVEYQDCDPGYPVVWCETSGQGHSRQDGLAAPAFWDFFQDLMSQ